MGRPAAELLSYRAAFELHLGLNPHSASTSELAAAALRRGLTVTESFAGADRDEWLNLLLAHWIEPRLGRDRPTILYHYPASQAALCRCNQGPSRWPMRFELYVDGTELANGYQELLDAAELRRRSERANRQRAAAGKYTLPIESRLLRAMDRGLPPAPAWRSASTAWSCWPAARRLWPRSCPSRSIGPEIGNRRSQEEHGRSPYDPTTAHEAIVQAVRSRHAESAQGYPAGSLAWHELPPVRRTRCSMSTTLCSKSWMCLDCWLSCSD